MRENIRLAGLWRFQPDRHDEGIAAGYGRPDFDRRLWRQVAVPGVFDRCGPGMDGYEGIAWFARTVTVPAGWRGRHVAIRFEGVNYHAKVWVNGRHAGDNEDGFLRFDLDVTGLVDFGGENVVVVRADNIRRKGEVPGLQRGWRPFGGILREVELIASSPLRIADGCISARPATDGGALALDAVLANGRDEPAEAELTVAVLDAEGRALARLAADPVGLPAGMEAQVHLEAGVPGAMPWSPEDPRLYTARCRLSEGGRVVDEAVVRFGFRTIEARDGRLLLNGQAIFLTGFNRHEDSPRTDMATDLATARADLEDMKAIGCNFVRLCHYPHHPGELDICDELGLLAMDEIPLYWWDGLNEGEENCAAKLAAADRQVRSMIARDRNHPSLIFWSVSNENKVDRPEVVEGNMKLVRLAQSLDPTRLAAHVVDQRYWPKFIDFDADDVVCLNAYPHWRGRSGNPFYDEDGKPVHDMADAHRFWREGMARLHEKYPDKPILVTEFGYPVLEGVVGEAMGEDIQQIGIAGEMEAMDAPYVCGTTIWCYADHAWPGGGTAGLRISPYGVVGRRRRRKKAHATVKRLFMARQGVLAPPASAPKPGPAGWSLVMIRPDLENIPQFDLPEGFSFCPVGLEDAGLWEDIIRDAEQFARHRDGLFDGNFGSDPSIIPYRCFFIVDRRGVAVATVSAWPEPDYRGQDYGRIHWVYTRPAWQRLGLARAGLTFALNTLAQWHTRAILGSQSRRLAAIRLYLDFGFRPDMEAPNARVAWREVREGLDHPALRPSSPA